MNDKVSFISLGCEKNRINCEIMIAAVRAAGYEITGEVEDSALCVINTCGFIEDAKKEALDTFFEVAALKKEGKVGKIIVSGCLPERYSGEIADELYEADGFVGVGSFDKIVEAVERVLAGERVLLFDGLENIQLEGERFVTGPGFATCIKIADGCVNRCAFCAIPLIRGSYRSRTMESVVAEAEKLVADGAKELTVIAQDTTSYGIDLYGKRMLPELLRRLCKTDVSWIRLMYLYPDKITDELVEVIKSEDKIVKYIEMPIQHSCGRILRAMHRPGDTKSLLATVEKLRREIPGVTLRTTIMVGFPGEDDGAFEELCGFLKKARFDRLGVFKFSPESGTPAADMEDQVPDDVKDSRAEAVELLQSEIALENQQALIGKRLTVLCEGYDRYAECYFGRSAAEAADIDGKIFFSSDGVVSSGDFVTVEITECMDFELIGERIS